MAAGYTLDQTGDVGTFEDMTLGPADESQWWFHWDFETDTGSGCRLSRWAEAS